MSRFHLAAIVSLIAWGVHAYFASASFSDSYYTALATYAPPDFVNTSVYAIMLASAIIILVLSVGELLDKGKYILSLYIPAIYFLVGFGLNLIVPAADYGEMFLAIIFILLVFILAVVLNAVVYLVRKFIKHAN